VTFVQIIWTIIFIIAVLMFLVVEIIVTVGGARDLVYMLKILIKQTKE